MKDLKLDLKYLRTITKKKNLKLSDYMELALIGDYCTNAVPKLLDRIELLERKLELCKIQRNTHIDWIEWSSGAEIQKRDCDKEIEKLSK